MKTQTEAPDADYDFVNTLYYQTRKNRFTGCGKEKLRRMLAMSAIESQGVIDKLIANGLVSETISDVTLTEDGWKQVLGSRRDKTHATLYFTSVTELNPEREASVYRFDYTLRDNAFRRSSQTITISISNQLSMQWEMRRLDESKNDPLLIPVLRRYALDYITEHLVNNNLRVHEHLQLGADRMLLQCRYNANDLPGSENLEYEIEWAIRNRS